MSTPRRKRSDRSASEDGDGQATDASVDGGDGFADAEQIRARAYELYLERGAGPSDEMEDWLRAEREYRGGAHGERAEDEDTQHPRPA